MMTRLKNRLAESGGPLLDRLIVWSGALLILAITAFAIHHLLDQGENGSTVNGEAPKHQIARYEQAVQANPADAATRISLARLYYASQRYSESAEQYQAALAIDRESVLALVGLGEALLALGDETGAIDSLQQVIDLADEANVPPVLLETAHYYLGSVYLNQQRPDEAITYLRQALAIEHTNADTWHLLGAAHIQKGDLDEAIDALSQAILFVPDFAEAYEKLALAYQHKDLLLESRYALGMLAYAQGRYGEAIAELEAVLQDSPDFADAYVGLGLARESQGERELALIAYQQAARLEPDNFNARAGLARLGTLTSLEATAPHGVTP